MYVLESLSLSLSLFSSLSLSLSLSTTLFFFFSCALFIMLAVESHEETDSAAKFDSNTQKVKVGL